jgi:hypothetical protein
VNDECSAEDRWQVGLTYKSAQEICAPALHRREPWRFSGGFSQFQSGMWRHVAGWVVMDVSKKLIAFISQGFGGPGLFCAGYIVMVDSTLENWDSLFSSKRWKLPSDSDSSTRTLESSVVSFLVYWRCLYCGCFVSHTLFILSAWTHTLCGVCVNVSVVIACDVWRSREGGKVGRPRNDWLK